MNKNDYLNLVGLCLGGTYDVDVYCTDDDRFSKGDMVSTTSSKFSFNSVTDQFDDNVKYAGTVKAVLVDVDCSAFTQGKCNDGGDYSYHYYVVL
jgi:hypothetical protein